jgi:hypothetical protein
MTKRRRPLTFERALWKVAAQIGWEEAAEIVGVADRTIRNWSDPDTTASVTLDAALKLDLAFRLAGGDGAPMLQCYSTRLEADLVEASADLKALTFKIAKAAKEGGEAIAAAAVAALPGASDNELARAELELEESIAASVDTLAALRAGRRGDVQTGTGLKGTAGPRPGEGEN